MNNNFKFNKFDYKEPLKRQLTASNIEDAEELFKKYSNIIFKGKNNSSISAKSYEKEGITLWMGSTTVKGNAEIVLDIISMIESFSNNNQILFGKLSLREEHDSKHKEMDEYSYGWKGSSIRDFLNFLPGIYWYTIFGKELVDAIGIEKLKNLPNVIYSNVNDGSIAFHLDEPLLSDNLENRLLEEKKIENLIGETYFYGKTKNLELIKHPKQFQLFLDNLGKK